MSFVAKFTGYKGEDIVLFLLSGADCCIKYASQQSLAQLSLEKKLTNKRISLSTLLHSDQDRVNLKKWTSTNKFDSILLLRLRLVMIC